MTHSRFWYIWLMLFFGFIILGGSISFIFVNYLNPHFKLWTPPRAQERSGIIPDVSIPNIRSHPDQPALTLEGSVALKNPFIIPSPYQRNSGFRPTPHRRRGPLEYRGIIETDSNIMALVTVTSSGESLVVYEGEDLVELGIMIGKISAKTLTYSKNGIETVISLGGIKH